jgi:hypothetical protein
MSSGVDFGEERRRDLNRLWIDMVELPWSALASKPPVAAPSVSHGRVLREGRRCLQAFY